VGRQHLADPDFLKNAVAGHPEDSWKLPATRGCLEREAWSKSRCAARSIRNGQECCGLRSGKEQTKCLGGGRRARRTYGALEAARLGPSRDAL
jgi:hypothetical protein